MNRFFRTILVSAALTFGIIGSATLAEALTIQEITAMTAQGLSDEVIIAIVNSADDLPKLEQYEITRLEEAGVSPRVLTAIHMRYLMLHEPETSNKNVASADNLASSGDDTVPVVGDETILSAVESSNIPLVFQKFFEEAYETYSVQAEVARRYAQLQSDTENARAYDSEVPKVIGYISKIDENPVSALESCLALMEQMNPPIDSPLGAALNQCTGLALRALSAPTMAAPYLDRALQSKAKIRDYTSTFEAFLETAHASDYTSSDPLRFKDHFGEINESGKSAFLYFISYSLIYGASPDVNMARQFLANIPKSSDYYPRAKILQAALAVRAPEFRFKSAAEYLTEAIKLLENNKSSDAYEQTNMAWLALARIAYENRAFDIADSFYRKVDVNSHHLRDAVLEDAWGQLFAGEFEKALSLTHALHAPFFNKAWLPDLLLIEAASYLGLCRYDMSSQAIEAFRATTLADAPALNAYMASTPAHDFYNQILQYAENPAGSPIPASVYKRVLNDFQFRTLHKTIRKLSDERKAISQFAGANFASLSKIQAIYDESISLHQQRMATVLAGIYDKTLAELHALDISASQIAIEIRLAERQREADCLKIVASGGTCDMSSGSNQNASFEKRDNDVYWSFDGEFWRDEILYYVSGVSSLCPGERQRMMPSASSKSSKTSETSSSSEKTNTNPVSGAPKPPDASLLTGTPK